MKRILLTFSILLSFSFFFPACQSQTEPETPPESALPSSSDETAPIPEQPAAPEEPEEPAPSVCTLIAVGDCISHDTVVKVAKNNGSYDFSPYFDRIRPYSSAADLAVINMEAPMGGKGYEPSGYPCFNAPQALGRDVAAAGFNVISHANNHAMDRGKGAAMDTIDFWETYADQGILMTGYYRDAADRDRLRIVEKNGVRVGFLSYTYGLNGFSLPEDNPDLVPLIDEKRMESDLARLTPECDLTVVIMHWGSEYTHTPSSEQRRLAEFLTERGAGLIIGHHPHVIQPAEWIETEHGRAFCVYSLGNFLSSQKKPATMLEGMLSVRIVRQPDGATSVESPELIPLVNYYDGKWTTFKVYPLSEYTDELAQTHRVSSLQSQKLTPAYFSQLAKEVYGEFLADSFSPKDGAEQAPSEEVGSIPASDAA